MSVCRHACPHVALTSIACAPGGAPGGEPVARAVLRKTHISPQKLNDFARLLRRLHVEDALIQCEVSPKKAARICRKVGRSRLWPRFPEG